MENKYSRKIFYYETDQMGIVHHSNYVRWLEEARLDFMEKVGMPYKEVEKSGLLIVVLSVSCRYIRAMKYGETYEIHTHLVKMSGVKMRLVYEIYEKDSNVLCATAETEHGITDRELKPVRLKRDFPEIYEKMMGACEG